MHSAAIWPALSLRLRLDQLTHAIGVDVDDGAEQGRSPYATLLCRGSALRNRSCLGAVPGMSQLHPTIVVLDDDSDTAAFLCDFFGMLGLSALACPVGPDAATCIVQHRPRLVILDVQLGDLTGIDVFHQVRDDSSMRTVPVIFFTGSEDQLRAELPDYHAHGAALVVKPDVEQVGALAQQLVAAAA